MLIPCAAAIDASLAAFEGRQAEHQALVVITDGEDLGGDLDAAIKQATDRGVKIYTVGIGTSEGELIPLEKGGFVKDRKGNVVKSRLDETTLQKIANDTGGAYLHATDTAFGLAELYRDYIATMEKRELASTLERRFEHRFQWPLVLAFLLLLIEPLIGERRPLQPQAAAQERDDEATLEREHRRDQQDLPMKLLPCGRLVKLNDTACRKARLVDIKHSRFAIEIVLLTEQSNPLDRRRRF